MAAALKSVLGDASYALLEEADVADYVAEMLQGMADDGSDAEELTEAVLPFLLDAGAAPDEEEGGRLCAALHKQLCGDAAAPSAAAPCAEELPRKLDVAISMGEEQQDDVVVDLLSRSLNVDAMGNRISAAGRANAASIAAKEAKAGGPVPKKGAAAAAAAEAEEEDADGDEPACFGLLKATAVSRAEQAKRDAAELAARQAEREKACELYLLSKAAGGSRDVLVKGLILLAPHGKPLVEEAADGTKSELRLVAGRRYGLVGRNGTGKTTLLNAIARYEITAFPRHLKVVYVEQEPSHDLDASPLSTVLGYDLEQAILRKRIAKLQADLAAAEAAARGPTGLSALFGNGEGAAAGAGGGASGGVPGVVSQAPRSGSEAAERAAAERHLARVRKRLEESEALLAELGCDDAEARAASILAGLQFTTPMMREPLRSLSGGWRMRVTLAAALFVPCDVLLLDEPTNHLDFPALQWLTAWLQVLLPLPLPPQPFGCLCPSPQPFRCLCPSPQPFG